MYIHIMSKFCPECGSPVPENAKFCPECGAPLSVDAPLKPNKLRGLDFFSEDIAAELSSIYKDRGRPQDDSNPKKVRDYKNKELSFSGGDPLNGVSVKGGVQKRAASVTMEEIFSNRNERGIPRRKIAALKDGPQRALQEFRATKQLRVVEIGNSRRDQPEVISEDDL